jgi:hypothetical protein
VEGIDEDQPAFISERETTPATGTSVEPNSDASLSLPSSS